jgi:thymidylate synthase (FAD)
MIGKVQLRSDDRDDQIDKLRWHKFELLSDGFVCLVDVMGDDAAICQAARVSYGAGTKSVSDDRTLIRYLMRHRHTTPFEMAEVKLLIRIPMDAWRQFIRHRTANVNEYSTRYSEAIDSCDITMPDAWRLQDQSNKQGSSGFLPAVPEGTDCDGIYGGTLSADEQELHATAWRVYQSRLDAGVAREQARKDLPLSMYTEAYWKCDLHNIFHFLALRMDSHAQKEIREYATTIGEQIIAPLFPLAWEAFLDYRLDSMTLSRVEIEAIKQSMYMRSVPTLTGNKRESEEFAKKLARLGIGE